MKQLYDELDANGNIVASAIMLIPGLKLPEGHSWVEHIPSLEDIKATRNIYVNNCKDVACYMPIAYNGYEWQADSRSQSLLSSAILLAQIGVAPAPSTWRSLDNIDVPVDLDFLKGLAGAMAYQTQQAYAKSWTLKAQIAAASTAEAVNAIDWT